VYIAVNGTPSHSYRVLLAILDHTVLPACHLTQVNTPRLNHRPVLDLYLPRKDGRLSWPMWLVTYRYQIPDAEWECLSYKIVELQKSC